MPSEERRVVHMVTYAELFTYTLVLIGIVGLCIQFHHKKK